MGSTGRDESLKPVDTVNDSSLEQESVITCSKITSHAGKFCPLGQWQLHTKTYHNVMITGIEEFDLDQESDGKLKITVHCKY